jgi:N utilization substance protein B
MATPDRARAHRTSERGATRTRARELVVLTLCHLESYPRGEWAAAIELLWAHPPEADPVRDAVEGPQLHALVADAAARAHALALLEQLTADADALDARIDATSRRWRVARMDRVDRNVLRLAALELSLPAGSPLGAPPGVVLAEAVRLAGRYGGERSAPFVNGVADALAKRARDGAALATDAGPAGADAGPPAPAGDDEDGA